MNSYKASESNDVNGSRAAPGPASGRRIEVSSTVIMRNPLLSPSSTQHDIQHQSTSTQKVFNVREIRGDGNCLFRAVSLHLYKTQEEHMKLRLEAVAYIRRHWTELKDHIMLEDPEDSDGEQTPKVRVMNQRSYCYKMKQNKTFGTSVEILAMSETHNLEFNIYAVANRPKHKTFTTENQPTVIRKQPHTCCINLLLTGNLEKGHFELLEPQEHPKEKAINYSSRATPQTQTKPVNQVESQRKNQEKEEQASHESQTIHQIHKNKQNLSIPSQKQTKSDKEARNLLKKQENDEQVIHESQIMHQNQTKKKRTKWSNDEYKEIIWCHMKTIETTGTTNIINTFNLWQSRNPTSEHAMNANTLAAQRRFILNNNKLTSEEIKEITSAVRTSEANQPVKELEMLKNASDAEKEPIATNEQTSSENKNTKDPKTPTAKEETEDNNKLKTLISEIKRKLENDTNTENEIERPPLKKINKNERAQQLIILGNMAIKEIMIENDTVFQNVTDLNKLIYATAESIQDILIPPNTNQNKKKTFTTAGEPPWKVRLQKKINEMRKDLSQLHESAKDNISASLKEKKEELFKKYKIKNPRDHAQIIEKVKQLISAKAHRIKRYSERSNQYHQNKQFNNSASRFYSNVLGKNKKVVTTPSKEEVENHWKSIWGRETKHNSEATWAEIRKMDRQTRKLLTMYGALHPRADVDRLYIPRKEGGRGLLGIEASYIIATEGLKNYLKLKCRETYLGMVYRHLYSANDTNDTEEDDLSDNDAQSHEPEKKTVKRIKDKMKQENKEERIKTWKNKEMHGQIAREAEKDTINVQQSWKWLSHSNLKAETEALITACQEQAIATNYMKARIMKTGTDPKCRLCRVHNETIHHVVSGCSILAKKEYLERHNKVAAHLHWNICKEFNIEVKDKWYEHSPDPVIDTPDVTIIWDTQVQTDRAITANKPDIIIKNKKTNRCILIDIAVPSDYNITQKEAEKRLKYKDLQIEVQRLWKMKTSVIPVVIGCTGLISNYTCETIKEVPGKHNILTLQKTVVLSTARIIRKVL
ncbi:hypothetical protein M8J75_014551 [Diaphorina citri]|nr:hypothetical protein M8J75_014551 [Diaphorina citri]